ncbi:hypothetical protein [Cetobacterium sp.]
MLILHGFVKQNAGSDSGDDASVANSDADHKINNTDNNFFISNTSTILFLYTQVILS